MMETMPIKTARETVVRAGIRLVETGLTSRTWGNISCRIDENTMAITPSGRDYLSMKTEDIVVVRISDCSYSGDLKPSVEKGMHAALYRLFPDVGCVIHTHQANASVAGALGLKSLIIPENYPLLGDEVLCADYGIPGTKKLSDNVMACARRTKGHAVLMAYHGAIFFGKDQEEGFQAASQLEAFCEVYIEQQYMKISGSTEFDSDRMRQFALTKVCKSKQGACKEVLQHDSMRTENGALLLKKDGVPVEITSGSRTLDEEMKIHESVYNRYHNINYIKFSALPNTRSAAAFGINLRPLLDDCAQIAGTLVKTADRNPADIAAALKKPSAVFVRNEGALCAGKTKEDAEAVAMILEKTCKTLVGAALFDHVKPLSRFSGLALRMVYKAKYSKEKYKK